MTVGELKEFLEDLDDGMEVKLALQPNYPMRGAIRNLCVQHGDEEDGETLWIACSDNLGYDVPRDVWDESEIYAEDDDEEEIED